jgi:hypothetical protein
MLDDTIAAYRRSLDITRNKLAAGTVSAADVESARTTLANAEASRRDLERQRASYENAIAVLVGENPRTSGWKAPPGSPPCPMCPPWCPRPVAAPPRCGQCRKIGGGGQFGHRHPARGVLPHHHAHGSLASNSSTASNLFSAASSLWSLGQARPKR